MKNLNEKQLVNVLVKANLIEDVESVTDVYINDNNVVIDTMEGDFVLYNNYSDAETDAVESALNLIDDCGLTENLVLEAELQGLIDINWFKEFWEEVHEGQAYNEDIQYIANEEELEMLDNGEITEEEIRDNYYETLQNSISGDYIGEYKFQFGEEDFQNTLTRNNLIDTDALATWCVDMDGVAHYLASYDGEEYEQDGYYIYRTN